MHHLAPTIVSRHRTSEGTIVYARDDRRGLTIWLEADDGPRRLDRRAHDDDAGTAPLGWLPGAVERPVPA